MIGLGTAALGRPQYINIRSEKSNNFNLNHFKRKSFQVLENAYKSGIRYFDTAPGYGLAEELILDWLQTKQDPSIKIGSKWGYTYTANFNPNAKTHEVKEHSLSKLKEQWDFSKKLLPYLKIYQIHSATLETGVLENTSVLEYLAFLKKKHQLKIGITTTGIHQLEVLQKALQVSVNNKKLFDSFQITCNILDQSLLDISSKIIEQQKTVIVKETLANGRLMSNKNYPQYSKLYAYIRQLSKKYSVGEDAIALQFVQQSIPKSIVLSGASTKKQLKENLKITSFLLSDDEINLLKSFKISTEFYWNERKKLDWN